MQIIRGDFGGRETAIGYLRLCRVIQKRRRAMKVSAQRERLYRALDAASEELTIMKKSAVESVGEEHGEIYEIYLKILKSESLRIRLLSGIESGASSEESVRDVILSDSVTAEGEFSRRHLKDCLDLLMRVLEDVKCPEVSEPTKINESGSYIYVSDFENPDELISILKKFKKGDKKAPVGVICATADELRTAVAMELPSLLIAPERLPDESFDGVTAILDCQRRRLILDPDLFELEKYSESGRKSDERVEELSRLVPIRSVTPTGIRIRLFEERLPKNGHYSAFGGESGADTGLLALTDGISPDCPEQAQYEIYRKLAENRSDIAVRLFEFPYDRSSNDTLFSSPAPSPSGLRGSGLFALFRQVYKTQLKALLRAAAHGPISVILPSLSSEEELCVFRSVLCEARSELKEGNVPFSEFIRSGIEIATPASALSADVLCRSMSLTVIDFDRLISLTSAAELCDPIASDQLKSGLLPTLKLCSHAIDVAGDTGTQFAVRGEFAADPSLTHSLIECGFRSFFLDPEKITEVKESVLSYRGNENH